MTPENTALKADFESGLTGMRMALAANAKIVLDMVDSPLLKLDAEELTAMGIISPEVFANLMLSYRHIEDASMRLGKVLQALNGGVSNNTK